MRQKVIAVNYPIYLILGLALTACGQGKLDDAIGKTYYVREAGYTCQPQLGGAPIPSHKDSIKIENMGIGTAVCVTGDACNDYVACTQATDQNVQVLDGGASVQFRGTTYTQ